MQMPGGWLEREQMLDGFLRANARRMAREGAWHSNRREIPAASPQSKVVDLRPRRQGCPEVAGCSRIRDNGGPGQSSRAGGGRDGPGRPERVKAGSSGRSQRRPEKREPRPWTDPESLGLCCREARIGTKPSDLLFASQRAGLKAIPIITPDLSSLSFLSKPVVVAASTRSLLCCRCRGPRFDGYYVCNPTTTAWVALPLPTNDHGAAVALVFDESGVYNFRSKTFFFFFV